MNYRHLGRSGLLVSPLCLGTMNFGPQTSEPDGTRDQTPGDVQRIAPSPVFATGDTVPNLSSWVLERKLGGGG